jgi:hypothetical protein
MYMKSRVYATFTKSRSQIMHDLLQSKKYERDSEIFGND